MDGSDRDRSASGRREPLLESWGNGGERGLLEPGWGLPGGSPGGVVRKGMAPGNRQLLEKPEDIFINCLQVCPVCNLSGRDNTGRGRVRVRVMCPPPDCMEGREAFARQLGGRRNTVP